MSKNFNREFVEVVVKLENNLKELEALKAQTQKLKELYKASPNDLALLDKIKEHERLANGLLKEFQNLKERAKSLDDK